MSVETKARREQGANPHIELWVTLCKCLAQGLMANLPEDDRDDLLEVLKAMGQSEEEMEHGAETIREMLEPVAGTLLSMIHPAGVRPAKVKKWSKYAGGQVYTLRKEAGLTQEQLARKADLPQSHISRIENGEVSPTRHTLEKIAKALDKPVTAFDPT